MAPTIVQFVNGRLAGGGRLVEAPLFIDTAAGKIIAGPGDQPFETVDLQGRYLAPGLIDIQLNGFSGMNYSDVPDNDAAMPGYVDRFRQSCRELLKTGVTSFLPTLVTNDASSFPRALPHLAPNGHRRDPHLGAESLGAHCEGPFLSLAKKGGHPADKLRTAATGGMADFAEVYGAANMAPRRRDDDADGPVLPPAIRKITVAPELDGMLDVIRQITSTTDIRVAMGHTQATYATGLRGLEAGASMLTHIFNAMPSLHHRDPGLVGLITASDADLPRPTAATTTTSQTTASGRPFFGLVADGVHIHPAVARLVFSAHEDGCILTTDGTSASGMDLPDGFYDWPLRIEKSGHKLTLAGTDTIAGSTAQLLDCVSNLVNWAGIDVARALKTVTENPVRMVGYADTKGVLAPGADADLVVLAWDADAKALKLHQVWKFGVQVHSA